MSSVSSSNSSSFIPDYPQSDLLQQIAQIASTLGQQQYQWAQGQFANTSQLTDQAVGQYLQAANSADALAQNNLQRYTQEFQPLEDQLIQDANSYNSTPRIQAEMGKAESGAGQSMDANRINAERQLQSYGIDPSSGRYAELEQAQNAQRGAAQAGAGQQAEYNTENTGRQLRSQAIQVGQQYPGQAVNALNAETQNLSGAVNAKLANLNAGTAALQSADPFLNTAMGLKYPPLGNHSGSSSFSTQPQRGQSGSGGGGGGGSPAGGSYMGPVNQPSGGINPAYMSGGVGTYQPNASIMGVDGGYSPDNFGGSSDPFQTYGQDVSAYTNYDPNGYSQFADTSSNAMPGGGTPFDTYGQDYGAYTNYGYGQDTSGGSYSGDTSGGSSGGYDAGSSYSDPTYSGDPTAGYSDFSGGSGFGGADNSGYTGFDNSGGGGDLSAGDMFSSFAAGGPVDPFGDFFSSAQQRGGSAPSASSAANGVPAAAPASGGFNNNNVGEPAGTVDPMAAGGLFGNSQGNRNYGVSLAAGGDPTTGGQITPQMSPSGGRMQDDVPANLNEGEFVVPRDVAMWKGQEFFQKLIDQSRKARMGASAQGKPGPRAPGPVRFASKAMG